MVNDDQEKLGPAAVEWWNTFFILYEAEVKKLCPKCLDYVKKVQEVRPHSDSTRHAADNKAKRAAVYHDLSKRDFVSKMH